MRRINGELINKWITENGEHEAVAKIMAKTGLSASTIEKLTRGQYPSQPSYLVRKALLDLTKMKEDELFPNIGEAS